MGGRGRAVRLHSLFVQDSACHINRYEYWMRAERCCAQHSQGSTLQIKLFFPPFIKLTIKQLMVQTSCRDLFRLDVFNKLSRCKMVALTNCWLDKSSLDKNMCQIWWGNKRQCLTYCFSLTRLYLPVCLLPSLPPSSAPLSSSEAWWRGWTADGRALPLCRWWMEDDVILGLTGTRACIHKGSPSLWGRAAGLLLISESTWHLLNGGSWIYVVVDIV